MPAHKQINERCGITHALDLVGDRWALLVVRELLLGARRFSDLESTLGGVSTNILTKRLEELTAKGVVRRRQLPSPGVARVYELTEYGMALEPILLQLGDWGLQSPTFPRRGNITPSSLVLALRHAFRPGASPRKPITLVLRLRGGRDVFRVDLANRALSIRRGEADRANAVLDTEPEVLIGILFDGRELEAALQSKRLRVEGDDKSVRSFIDCFSRKPMTGKEVQRG